MGGMNRMRLALISTPRSGNTWLRLLLGDLFDLSHFAVHAPGDLDWRSLPSDSILQLHWPKDFGFVEILKAHGFKTVTICRHPLDIFLSILNFAKNEPETAHWLCGKRGDESRIIGKFPTSQDFLRYSCSARARHLLDISTDWWAYADVPVKYEDLVSNPEDQLVHIAEALNQPISRVQIIKAIEKFKFKNLQPTSNNQHYWKGSPGHWSRYISVEAASVIYDHHRHIFEGLGYTIVAACGSLEECEMRYLEESSL